MEIRTHVFQKTVIFYLCGHATKVSLLVRYWQSLYSRLALEICVNSHLLK